jgi:uncharacterized membrane protein
VNNGIQLLLIVLVACAAFVMIGEGVDAAGYDLTLELNDTARVKVGHGRDPIGFNWTLTNNGSASNESIIIDVIDAPVNWTNLVLLTNLWLPPPDPVGPPTEVLMEQGEAIDLWLFITPPANQTNDTYWFTVIAYPKADPNYNVTHDVAIILPQEAGFQLELWNPPPGGTFRAIPPSTVTIRFALFNSGNGVDRFLIRGSSSRSDDGWTLTFIDGVDEYGYTDEIQPDPMMVSPYFIDVNVPIPAGIGPDLESIVTLNATSMFDASLQEPAAMATVRTLQYYNFKAYISGPDKKDAVPGDEVEFQLKINNSGNGMDTFTIQAIWDLELNPGFNATANPMTLDIDSMATETIQYIVKVPVNAPKKTYFLTAEINSLSPELAPITKSFAVEVGQIFGIELTCDEPWRLTIPGGNLEFEMTVRNTGNGLDSIVIQDIHGAPQGWLTYTQPPEVTLLQGKNATIKIIVIVPSAFEEPPLLGYTLTVTAKSSRSDAEDALDLTIDIEQFWRIEWMYIGEDITNPDRPVAQTGSIRPRTVIDLMDDTSATVVLTVKNYGNALDEVTLEVKNDFDHMDITIFPDSFTLVGGGTKNIHVEITVPRDGRTGVFYFHLNAISSDPSFITRVVPLDVEVKPVYSVDDFIDLSYADPLNDDYTFTFTADQEGGEVIRSRGRLTRSPGIDINNLMATLDPANGTAGVVLICGEILDEEGTEYWVYFVNKSHRQSGPLLRPGVHNGGEFSWTFSDPSFTYLGLWYSNGEWGSTRDISRLNVSATWNGLTFTMPSRELRRAGVSPSSGFGVYAYAQTMTETTGDEYRMRVAWDSAGLGAARPPSDFTNEPEESPMPPFLAPLAIALVAVTMMAVAGRIRLGRRGAQ